MLYRRYADGPNGALDMLLGYPLSVHGVAATHIVERLRIAGSCGALEAASRLCFDKATGSAKRGYSDASSGLRAYCRFLNNLPDHFDLAALSAHTIMALLPQVFDVWMDSDSAKDIAGVRKMFRLQAADGIEPVVNFDELLQGVHKRALTEKLSRVRSDVFRSGVLSAYRSRCAISGPGLAHVAGRESATFEVEAAHIVPVSRGGRDLIQNGLALNRTVHWAFDLGMIWLDDDLRIHLCRDTVADRRNEWLAQFHGRLLNLPADARHRPHRNALRWHAENAAAIGR